MLKGLFILFIRAYQVMIRPLLRDACRFSPSCSQYAIEAVKKHGAFKGGYLGVKRMMKCHPWGPHGYDPVP
jgi:uncharacterized protein